MTTLLVASACAGGMIFGSLFRFYEARPAPGTFMYRLGYPVSVVFVLTAFVGSLFVG